jgi:hypothetical protein
MGTTWQERLVIRLAGHRVLYWLILVIGQYRSLHDRRR